MKITPEEMKKLVDEAEGGYWIRPDGLPVPVPDKEGHADTLHGDVRLEGFHDGTHYGSIVSKGGVRVTFCGSTFDYALNYQTVTGEALGTLIKLVQEYTEAPPHWMASGLCYGEEEYQNYRIRKEVPTPPEVADWFNDWQRRFAYSGTPDQVLRKLRSLKLGPAAARRQVRVNEKVAA